MFRRSGTRSFSAILWWSTATPGRSRRSSSAATACGFLNGCNSRFLILDFNQIPGVEVWQIGAEGGFLPAPVNLTADQWQPLLLALGRASRLDCRLHQRAGRQLCARQCRPRRAVWRLPGDDFEPLIPASTGQIMQFQVSAATEPDPTTPPEYLQLPAIAPLVPTFTRQISLNEEESKTIFVSEDDRWQRGI